jgi:hypothetical protein
MDYFAGLDVSVKETSVCRLPHLSGVKRTSRVDRVMSASDPKRTSVRFVLQWAVVGFDSAHPSGPAGSCRRKALTCSLVRCQGINVDRGREPRRQH